MLIPKKAEKWRKAMEMTKQGKTVLKNIEREENVPSVVKNKFFRELSKTYTTGTNPLEHMENVLSSLADSALSGSKADIVSMELLIRFSRMARFPDQPLLKKAGISFSRLLKNPGLISVLTKLHLGNRRGIVWAAIENLVSSDIANGMPTEKILNKLGLTEKFVEPWYQAVYNASDVRKPCLVPTVLDAGSDHRFRPPIKDAPYGITSPRSGGGTGYPECVHQKCIIDQPAITLYVI